jgi:hypothetical protein
VSVDVEDVEIVLRIDPLSRYHAFPPLARRPAYRFRDGKIHFACRR